jgi:hypothetical protein
MTKIMKNMFPGVLCILFLISYQTNQLSPNFQITPPANVIDMLLSPNENLLFIYNSSMIYIYNALNGNQIRTITP